MRARVRLILATVVAGGAVVAPSAFASTSPARPVSLLPDVPASAGKLVNGAVSYLWPRGSKHYDVSRADEHAGFPVKITQSTAPLAWGGGAGTGNVAVTPAVYIVYWGSQWSKTDPASAYLTSFMKGLYGPGDDWTSVSQQYCEGISSGAESCPSTAPHIGVPNGELVKGVWFDDALPAVPLNAVTTAANAVDQMGAEAVRAAAHFGNTAAGSNAETQYVIALPPKFESPGEGYYCAYHSSVSSNYGDVAYTDLPYLSGLGATAPDGNGCGENAVNPGAAGTYDGFSIAEGHEFMETITDMRPFTGWRDDTNAENGDKCAWITSGQGAMANLTLSTGTFAVQSTWSNAFDSNKGGCVLHNS